MTYYNRNNVHPATFFLIGILGLEEVHAWISLPFCSVYLVALLGNATILLVIKAEQTLREPMFYFLAILSAIDLALSTTSVPRMLGIFWLNAHEFNFGACVAQMFLIHAFTDMEAEVLLAMAFDCFVAICAPLHYTTILTSRVLVGISMCIVIRPVLLTLPMIYLIYSLPFIGVSYIYILCAVYPLPSQDAHLKALSTCGLNIGVICVFSILSVFSFLTH